MLKNWCFWTVVLEKTLDCPLDWKEIPQGHPKGDKSWILIRRTVTEAETLILWPPDAKNWLIWKDPDAGKDWRWEEKGTTEDEMAGWHHWLSGHEFEQTLGDGQQSLVCCSPWARKELDTTEQLNNNNNQRKNLGEDNYHWLRVMMRRRMIAKPLLWWYFPIHQSLCYIHFTNKTLPTQGDSYWCHCQFKETKLSFHTLKYVF